jgi:hypothetical protein
MRRILLATAAVAIALTALPVASAEAATDCRLSGSRTVVRSSEALVTTKSGRLYACRFRTGRIFLIENAGRDTRQDPGTCHAHGIRSSEPRARRPKLAGAYLAYIRSCEVGSQEAEQLRVVDLRSGRVKLRAANGGDEVHDFVVKRNGSSAHIGDFTGSGREVRRMDRRGVETVGSGSTIDSDSLSLSRTRRSVTWLDAGVRRRASLR